jgi:transglutaminase-like putative cysteine protease
MNITRTAPARSRDRLKWLRLAKLPERDSQAENVRHLAGLLREASGGNRRLVVALCHAVARDGIRFVSDTARVGHEDIAGVTRPYADPLEALERGEDDCDAKGRLLVALLLAGGMGAKTVPWWDVATGDLDHVAAEVMLDGQWVHLETILSRARIGDEPAQIPVETSTGKWAYT